MQNKVLKLLVSFILLFSLKGFSQTTKQSDHPLLDKYYPRAEKDTNTTVATEIQPTPLPSQVSQIKPADKTLAAPVVADKIVTDKTINTSIPKPEPQLTSETISSPAVTDTVAKIDNPVAPPAETKLISAPIPSSVVADTTATKPINATVTLPVQPKVQPRAPAETPLMDTRLGSSTKAYDTWKKNNNGAGSVTTSAK